MGSSGTTSDVVIQAENIRHLKDVMTRLQSEHTGQPVETVAADSERDRWFTAEQALAYGMIDKIVDKVDDVRPGGKRRAGLIRSRTRLEPGIPVVAESAARAEQRA